MPPRSRAYACLRKANGGKAHAANAGLAVAQGEIVVAVDADTLILPGAIERLVAHFGDPEVTAVCGNVEVGNVNSWLTRFQAIEYVTSQNFDRRAFALLNSISVVPGALGAWRREAVLKVGGYSSDTLTEDADLTLTMLRAGGRIEYEPRAIGRTEAPETVSGLLKQRFRWTYGTYQCLFKHRKGFFKGTLGWVGMPNMVVFQVLFAALSPIGDLVMVLSIFRGDCGRLPGGLRGVLADGRVRFAAGVHARRQAQALALDAADPALHLSPADVLRQPQGDARGGARRPSRLEEARPHRQRGARAQSAPSKSPES